jgi:hypothetical protein
MSVLPESEPVYEQYATCIRPLTSPQKDGQWRAQYPGLDWYVTAESEPAAADKLGEEALRRVDAGEDHAQPPHDLLTRHLVESIPGVFALDRELFLYLRTEYGVSEVNRAFEEAERRRALGQPYTKREYLQERQG